MVTLSIITVTYNCQTDIEKTIKSVCSQTFSSFEYIIIDGASSDRTCEIISQYRNRLSYFISEKDDGIYYAMNKGIEVAKGEWILFINAGDVFPKDDVLERFFSFDLSDSGVCFGDSYNMINGHCFYNIANNPFYLNAKRIKGMGFSHQSVFVRSAIIKSHRFDTSFRCCADYYMMKMLYQEGVKFIHIPVPVVVCDNENGFSAQNRLLQFKEEAKICDADKSLLFFALYGKRYIRLLLKKWARRLRLME